MRRTISLLFLAFCISGCQKCYECTLTTPMGTVDREVCGNSNKNAVEQSGETCR